MTQSLHSNNAQSPLVLIVEDDPLIRKVNKILIQALGYVVATANNGEEAVQFCKETNFSVVLMDVNMPVMDGLEATQCIRNHCGKSLPIVAFTTDTSEETAAACLKAGMNAVAKKPLEIEGLKQLLQTYTVQLSII